MQCEDVVIVGGGPAGAYCAYELGKLGIRAVVFDHSHPREKPCGGGISPMAIQKFPFLEQFRSEGNTCSSFKILSCKNIEFSSEKYRNGYNISRRILDMKILEMATSSGAKLFEEKVLDIKSHQKTWKIKTNKQKIAAKILIGADGVNSIVRRKTIGSISKENLALTYGYLAKGIEREPTVAKFLCSMPGYIWIFPRKNYISIGIGSDLQYGNTLKKELDNFMQSEFVLSSFPSLRICKEFSALIPSAKNPDFFTKPCSGKNWILVGDAAGHVDPISGEGIQYALWSGKLAAKAVKEKMIDSFDSLYKKEYGYYLIKHSSKKKIFNNPVALDFFLKLHYSSKKETKL